MTRSGNPRVDEPNAERPARPQTHPANPEYAITISTVSTINTTSNATNPSSYSDKHRSKPWPHWLDDYCNADREIFPLPVPDFDDLDQFMWDLDTPYEKHVNDHGNVDLRARGLAAICLSEWLQGLFIQE